MSIQQRKLETRGIRGVPDEVHEGHSEQCSASGAPHQGWRLQVAEPGSHSPSQQVPNACSTEARECSETSSRSGPDSPSLLCLTPRSASQTRILALALQRNPFPSFTKKCLESRWQVGADVVRDILRHFGVDPGPEAGLHIPATDVLLCEGFSDPLAVWISASTEYRKILSADLLKLEDWIAQKPEKDQRDKTKYYRELSEGRLASVRIGKQHRFRQTLEAALDWHGDGAGSSL